MTILTAKNSELAVKAAEIAEQIAQDVKSATYKMTPYTSTNPTCLRQYVIDLIREQEWRKRVVTAVDGNMLFIKIKPLDPLKVKVAQYERLLELALGQIESESLYDEIYEALYGGKNGNG